MSNERVRYWSIQKHRLSDHASDKPLYSADKASLMFRSGRQRLRDAREALVCVGPIHGATDADLFDLAEIVSELGHAISIELSIRGTGKLCLLRFDTQDDNRSFLVSSVSGDH